MSYKIIAISRQFGSAGRTIGRTVSEKLNIPCYDQELIEIFAEQSGFSKEHIAEIDEHSVKRKLFAPPAERASNSSILQMSLWNIQEKVIRSLAEKGPCVIVGRCADYILKDSADCLRVYIHADELFRAERIVKVYGERDEEPINRIRDKDKRRKEYYQRYTNQKWGDAENFHIALDSGVFGVDTCVDILTKLYSENR